MRRLSIDGSRSQKSSSPIDARICWALATVDLWRLYTRVVLSGTFSARARRASWVVTPTGHRLVWQRWAWMQPTANIIARAARVKSAPWIRRLMMSIPLATLPEAPILIRSRSPVPTNALCTSISLR